MCVGLSLSNKLIAIGKSCIAFTIHLKLNDKLAKNTKSHNLVTSNASDQQAVLDDGNKAGFASDNAKTKDARVIVATKLIGGEATSAEFKVNKLNA